METSIHFIALGVFLLATISTVSAFSPRSLLMAQTKTKVSSAHPSTHAFIITRLAATEKVIDIDGDDNDDEEEVEPGKMRVSEIKAELELRGIDYSDCFDRESLAARLASARMTGKANPTIVDEFKQTIEENKDVEIKDEAIEKAVGGDGTLPGGMPPDMLKNLMANPELVQLLQSEKMQNVMKLMMTEGQEALQKAMEEDQETYELVMKLNKVMAESQ